MIDWISFSLPVEPTEPHDTRAMLRAVRAWLVARDHSLADTLGFDTPHEARAGRPPYSESWSFPEVAMTVFCNPRLPHALIEVSGRGCRLIDEAGQTDYVLTLVADRLTRLDIACDILTETRPPDFAARRSVARHRAHSHVVSDSGETYYVGSRSSDRYCRVYRYNPPHERSAFLRVEYVLKSEQARYTALSVVSDGVQAVAKALGDTYGWEHPDWQPDDGPAAELTVWRPDRHAGKTLYWLNQQVAPAIAKLVNDGVLDLDVWLTEQVKPRIINGRG